MGGARARVGYGWSGVGGVGWGRVGLGTFGPTMNALR